MDASVSKKDITRRAAEVEAVCAIIERESNMHHVLESSIGEKCKCGEPASHKVEEVLDFGSFSTIDEAVNAGVRHPLTVYLCCQCFSSLMGDPFNWCEKNRDLEVDRSN